MEAIERVLSRPVAKPYRTGKIDPNEIPYLNADGHVDFAEGDIENPRNWPARRRWYITTASILLVLNATFASSIPAGCLNGIAEQFHVSEVVAGLVITLFLLGYCFGPLFFAPLSEFFGRRWIFYGTFIGYVAFNFLCAFAPNFGSLLAGRFITGTFASAPLGNSPGVFADLWGPVERGNAMALFAVMTFAGPAVSPAIAGFLQLKEDWRWSFYVLLMFGGVTCIVLFTIPETHPASVLTNKARRIRRLKLPGYEHVQSPSEASGQTLTAIFKVALTRPWIILFDPISFFIAIYLTVTYTLVYMLFTIYPIVYREKRHWNSGVGELPLLGNVIGAAIGSTIIYFGSRKTAGKMARGEPTKPEDRLPLAQAGGIGFMVCLFWFGWSANYNSVHWIVPCIAGVCLSASIVLVFISFINYLTDSYLMYAASAVAANTVVRSAAAAASPLFTGQMFAALGVGGGASLIGGVAAILAVIPFAFYRYGEKIRLKSKFAPTRPSNNDEESQNAAEGKDGEPSPDVQVTHSRSSTDTSVTATSMVQESDYEKEQREREQRIAGEMHESDQNAFGEPRTENVNFGKQRAPGPAGM